MAVNTTHPFYKYATVASALACVASGVFAFSGNINTSDIAFISLAISAFFFFVTAALLMVSVESLVDRFINTFLVVYWSLFVVFVFFLPLVDGYISADLFGTNCWSLVGTGDCTLLGSISKMFHPASLPFFAALLLVLWRPLRTISKRWNK